MPLISVWSALIESCHRGTATPSRDQAVFDSELIEELWEVENMMKKDRPPSIAAQLVATAFTAMVVEQIAPDQSIITTPLSPTSLGAPLK